MAGATPAFHKVEQLKFSEPDFDAPQPQRSPIQTFGAAPPRFRLINRHQTEFRVFAIDDLIDESHPARAIWDFLGELDLTPFEQEVRAVEGHAGQPTFEPRLLIALWLYGYSRAVGSAREVSRLCNHHPGFRWICGDEGVNYHTLSDFRVKHEEALRGLLVDALGVLSYKGLVKLELVAHDGTKVQAVAGQANYHREGTLKKHLEEAAAQVAAVEKEASEERSERAQAARERAAREKQQRLKEAWAHLEEIRKHKKTAEEKAEARVSETEPEARMMKTGEREMALAYNVQVTTDAASGIIVNADVSTQASDFPQLVRSLEQVKENFGKLPDQVLADAGYISRENLMQLDGRTDLIGSYDEGQKHAAAQRERQGIAEEFAGQFFVYDAVQNRFVCPAEKILQQKRKRVGAGKIEYTYQAAKSDCQACLNKARCCPQVSMRSVTRIEDDVAVKRFREKMKEPGSKALYKQRSQIAEFPFCWLKEKFQLRRFHVRGLAKAQMEIWWAVLAYNISQWTRLQWNVATAEAIN